MNQIGAKDVERTIFNTVVQRELCKDAVISSGDRSLGCTWIWVPTIGIRPLVLSYSHSPFASRKSSHIDKTGGNQQQDNLN